VVELASSSTLTKQPGEIWLIGWNWNLYTAKYATTLVSATIFISLNQTQQTSVSVNASAGPTATTLQLAANPGIGALLTVNPGGPNQEKLLVSALGGGPPFPCTVSPLQFDHTSGEPVDYQMGVTTRLVTTATATIQGTQSLWTIRRGQSAQSFRVVMLATLSDGQIVQHTLTLSTPEV
jgi:hypothetical protein